MSSIKGIFKDSSFLSQLLLFIGLTLLLSAAASFVAIALVFIKGCLLFGARDLQTVMTGIYAEASSLRIVQFISSLGTFFFPAVLLAYLFSNDRDGYLYLRKKAGASLYFMAIGGIVFSLPFLNMSVALGKGIDLPPFLSGLESWLKSTEASNKILVDTMLDTRNYGSLALNVFIIGFVAALGEEFFFRGLLQRLLGRVVRNKHLLVWTVAFLFSAVHLEYSGFFARLLLGAYLGYLLIYTKCIWVPVAAHFANNTIGILSDFFFRGTQFYSVIDRLGTGNTWWLSVFSLALWGSIFFLLKKYCRFL